MRDGIRPIVPQDAGVLAGIFKDCFAAPPWNEVWSDEAAVRRLSQFIGTETCRGGVAFEGERAVGFALGQVEGWVDGNLFLLQEMCVVPDRQRSGRKVVLSVGRRNS